MTLPADRGWMGVLHTGTGPSRAMRGTCAGQGRPGDPKLQSMSPAVASTDAQGGQHAQTPGEVDNHDGDIVTGAAVHGGASQHSGGDARGAVAAGAALPRPPQAPLRQRARLL